MGSGFWGPGAIALGIESSSNSTSLAFGSRKRKVTRWSAPTSGEMIGPSCWARDEGAHANAPDKIIAAAENARAMRLPAKFFGALPAAVQFITIGLLTGRKYIPADLLRRNIGFKIPAEPLVRATRLPSEP